MRGRRTLTAASTAADDGPRGLAAAWRRGWPVLSLLLAGLAIAPWQVSRLIRDCGRPHEVLAAAGVALVLVLVFGLVLLLLAGGRSLLFAGVAGLACGVLGLAAMGQFVAGVTGALDRGKQKATMGRVRLLGDAVEGLRTPDGRYPVLSSVAELEALAGVELDGEDGWAHEILVHSDGGAYVVASPGRCGDWEVRDPSSYLETEPDAVEGTTDYRADIVLVTRRFVRLPDGTQR